MKKIPFLLFVLLISSSLFAQKFENLAMTPPMGWNSWNTFHRGITEDIVKKMADAMIETGLKDAGYVYINVDDCWQVDRDENGTILANPETFPSGMKSLGDYIHSKGLKFGIYSCAGELTCTKKPGSRGYEYQDAKTYASWGVDFLKYDFCFHGEQNAQASYKTMRDALYKAGRPIVFSICEWGLTEPWTWAQDIGHMWRTTIDITNCGDCLHVTGARGWLRILDESIPLWKHNGPGGWNDPDMLEVGNGMGYTEDKAHFTMWCMLSAPLILGNDLSNMSKETLSILTNKDVIAIDQDPMGKSAFRYLVDEDVEIWIKQLQNDEWAMAILNTNLDKRDYDVEWNIYYMTRYFEEWKSHEKYSLYNVWDKKEMGTSDDHELKGSLDGREVILIKLSPIK